MNAPHLDWMEFEDRIHVHVDEGNLDGALTLARQALDQAESGIADNRPMKAACLDCLGKLHAMIGDHETATTFLNRAVAVKLTFLDPLDESLGVLHLRIGRSQRALGKLENAERAYEKALQILRANTHPVDTEFVKLKDWLAGFYTERKKFKKAEALYLETLHAYEAHDADLLHRIRSISNLGGLHEAMADFKTAEDYFLQAVRLAETEHPQPSLNYAIALCTLGACYHAQRKHDAAMTAYLNALHIKSVALRLPDSRMVTELKNIALLYRHTGRPDEAHPFEDRLGKAVADRGKPRAS